MSSIPALNSFHEPPLLSHHFPSTRKMPDPTRLFMTHKTVRTDTIIILPDDTEKFHLRGNTFTGNLAIFIKNVQTEVCIDANTFEGKFDLYSNDLKAKLQMRHNTFRADANINLPTSCTTYFLRNWFENEPKLAMNSATIGAGVAVQEIIRNAFHASATVREMREADLEKMDRMYAEADEDTFFYDYDLLGEVEEDGKGGEVEENVRGEKRKENEDEPQVEVKRARSEEYSWVGEKLKKKPQQFCSIL